MVATCLGLGDDAVGVSHMGVCLTSRTPLPVDAGYAMFAIMQAQRRKEEDERQQAEQLRQQEANMLRFEQRKQVKLRLVREVRAILQGLFLIEHLRRCGGRVCVVRHGHRGVWRKDLPQKRGDPTTGGDGELCLERRVHDYCTVKQRPLRMSRGITARTVCLSHWPSHRVEPVSVRRRLFGLNVVTSQEAAELQLVHGQQLPGYTGR